MNEFELLKKCIDSSCNEGLFKESRGLEGLSGSKLVGMLQRFAKLQEERNGGCYLEVGVFQGLTLLSVARALTAGKAFGIDNFAQFDPQNKNQEIIEQRRLLNDLKNVELINQDYEDALENLSSFLGKQKIGVYFVDGPHDYRSQYMCLGLIKPFLSDSAVIVIDDCNYRHVRQANRDFLFLNPEFKLFFESYTKCHPHNMNAGAREAAEGGWWNGVNVIVKDSSNLLDRDYPPTYRPRYLYENEHVVHSSRYGALAPIGMNLVYGLARLNPVRIGHALFQIFRKRRSLSDDDIGEFRGMNTFSADICDEVRSNSNSSRGCLSTSGVDKDHLEGTKG